MSEQHFSQNTDTGAPHEHEARQDHSGKIRQYLDFADRLLKGDGTSESDASNSN